MYSRHIHTHHHRRKGEYTQRSWTSIFSRPVYRSTLFCLPFNPYNPSNPPPPLTRSPISNLQLIPHNSPFPLLALGQKHPRSIDLACMYDIQRIYLVPEIPYSPVSGHSFALHCLRLSKCRFPEFCHWAWICEFWWTHVPTSPCHPLNNVFKYEVNGQNLRRPLSWPLVPAIFSFAGMMDREANMTSMAGRHARRWKMAFTATVAKVSASLLSCQNNWSRFSLAFPTFGFALSSQPYVNQSDPIRSREGGKTCMTRWWYTLQPASKNSLPSCQTVRFSFFLTVVFKECSFP